MSAGGQLLLVWLLAALAQTAAWLHQRRTRNAGIVDVIWAGGVGAAAMLLGALGRGAPLSRLLLALFGGLWGLRLALHLWRRVSRETEDGRYASLRALWGEDQRRWFAFFQFQALLIALFTVPFLPAANAVREPSTPWLAAAAAVWLLGVVGETEADRQLARFRSDPGNKGRVCRSDSGATRAIRIISLNGCIGSPTSH